MHRPALLGLAAIALGVVACASEPTGAADGGPQSPGTEPPPTLPVADEVSATLGADGALGIVFRGRVGLGPVRYIRVELLDEQGEVFHQASGSFPWLARPNRFATAASVGHLDVSGSTFSGFASFVDTSLAAAPERVRVSFGETNVLIGEGLETAASPATPMSVELGERCDPFEVVSSCGEGELCDVPSGVIRDSPTCHLPSETCPFDFPVLQDVYEGSNAALPDDTLSSCTASRGNLGMEQGHVFTAPLAGDYRFTAESITVHAATTLFVRRYCEFAIAGVSELGCAHESEHEGSPLRVDVPLSEGQIVYAFVESWWASGGDYVLSVEAL